MPDRLHSSNDPAPRAARSGALPARERMRASKEVRQVLDLGTTLVGRFMVMKVLIRPEDDTARRFAVIASKKVGGSVERSRAKRRLRALYRLHRDGIPERGLGLVLIARYRAVKAPYSRMESEFRVLLRKADIWRDSKP